MIAISITEQGERPGPSPSVMVTESQQPSPHSSRSESEDGGTEWLFLPVDSINSPYIAANERLPWVQVGRLKQHVGLTGGVSPASNCFGSSVCQRQSAYHQKLVFRCGEMAVFKHAYDVSLT